MKSKHLRIIFFLMFVGLGILIKNNLTTNFDFFIYNLLISLKTDTLTSIFKTITYLGSTPFILTLNIICLLVILKTKNNSLFLLPINSLFSLAFNNLFKVIFRRARPSVLMLVTERGFSYPSGHTMISVLFYGTLILLINSSNFKYKNVINMILMLIIILITISRVYLGVHYITDIIGGYLLALSIIIRKEDVMK